jgi:hypothetical protein
LGTFRGGIGGVARGLESFQLAEAAFDGVLDAGFVARELGERVGGEAVGVERAGQDIGFVVLAGWVR